MFEWEDYNIEQPEILSDNSLISQIEEGVFLEHIGEHKEIIEELETGDCIAGNPEEDMDEWHLQTEQNSCAIACQSFVAEQLLDCDFSEKEMINHAKAIGIYRSMCQYLVQPKSAAGNSKICGKHENDDRHRTTCSRACFFGI